MKRSVIETILGAIVLLLAVVFLVFSYRTANVKRVSGYDVTAAFTGTGGLAEGDDVRISGVKIGSVNKLSLDPQKYLAIVTMSIGPDIKLPDDTSAIISSDSLLGGRYLELQPGGSDRMLKSGDKIQYTQAPQNLEQLLGKFIFSMSSKDDKSGQASAASDGNAAASAAMPPSLSSSAPPSNSETIAPVLPATPAKPAAKPVTAAPSTPSPSASTPAPDPVASKPAPALPDVATPPTPPAPPAPAVDTDSASPDAAPTALQPAPASPGATTPGASTPGQPGRESAMPDMPASQPAFSSTTAAPATP